MQLLKDIDLFRTMHTEHHRHSMRGGLFSVSAFLIALVLCYDVVTDFLE
jgi:hypothetical protein